MGCSSLSENLGIKTNLDLISDVASLRLFGDLLLTRQTILLPPARTFALARRDRVCSRYQGTAREYARRLQWRSF